MFDNIKKQISKNLSQFVPLESSLIFKLLEYPKKLDHGHLALPVFQLSKVERKAPPLLAAEYVNTLNNNLSHFPNVGLFQAAGGYINILLKDDFLQNTLSQSLKNEKIGYKPKKNERVVIDYSSPNVAKPMSIGHLRATVIGQAIRNLALSQGYDVTGLNYLGDWGVQFGKLAYAYLEWPEGKQEKYNFDVKPFDALFKLYVDFHAACENNPELEAKGSQTFKKLEEGDPVIKALWEKFLNISLNEYERIYNLLGIKFDLIQGESFYNDKMEATVQELERLGLLQESDGAQVVFLDENMPPCIIKKSDGATLYATRDITSAFHRHNNLKGDHLLYVVGVDQTLHFKQVFSVLKKMNQPWADNCHHIAFGMYRFKDMGKMSTRRGNVIFMDDVIEKALELAKKTIEQKNPQLENKDLVAQQVGLGAIIFHDLFTDRVKNIDFDWDRVLDFEGDTGPYIQYSCVRSKSLIKKWNNEIPSDFLVPLESKEERELVRLLLTYSEVLESSYNQFRPSVLAQYLIECCKAFGAFYNHHKILDAETEDLKKSRVKLVHSVLEVLTQGLSILGIQVPDRM